MSYQPSERDAIINAGRFMKEGRVDAIKVEGAADIAHAVKSMARFGVPVTDAGDRPFAAVAGFVISHCPHIAATKELGEK